MIDAEEFANAMAQVGASAGISVVDFLRAFGHDVIKTPDGEICSIVDAPSVEFRRDGLIFDERGVCIGGEE